MEVVEGTRKEWYQRVVERYNFHKHGGHSPVTCAGDSVDPNQRWIYISEYILERNLTSAKYVGKHLPLKEINEVTWLHMLI